VLLEGVQDDVCVPLNVGELVLVPVPLLDNVPLAVCVSV
jgi:hypothetical protein